MKAALRGKESHYTFISDDEVLLEKIDFTKHVIDVELFNDLFIHLNNDRVALYNDCVDYNLLVNNDVLLINSMNEEMIISIDTFKTMYTI